jgi:hypothetical protein
VNSDLPRRQARWHDSSDVHLKNLPHPQLMRHYGAQNNNDAPP